MAFFIVLGMQVSVYDLTSYTSYFNQGINMSILDTVMLMGTAIAVVVMIVVCLKGDDE